MKIVTLSLSDKRQPADIFFAGFFSGKSISKELAALEPELAKSAATALSKGRFSGKFSESISSYGDKNLEASEVSLLGLGEAKNHRPLCMRKTVGRIVQAAREAQAKKVRIFLDSFLGGEVDAAAAVSAISEIILLASYRFDRYKSKKEEKEKSSELQTVEILTAKKLPAAAEKNIQEGQAVARGVLLTRDLINEPGNVMHPQKLAEEARRMAKEKKISCKILGLSELQKMKMGGILAVNQGSVTPPALIVLEYGKNFAKKGTVCLVGKGVTFDTGGISIKPSKDMEKMKYDMSGAAAVIGAMSVASELNLPIHLVALAPAVENMVAENPQRPGDIIRMYNGKTVEVLNTDAEGRLILADALAYSEIFKPKVIIDLATLTGMCAYTFADKAIAVLGNDSRLISKIKQAGEETGERCWELPLWDEYAPLIKGEHSDFQNIGGPYAGTITAAMFLKEFVPEKTSWIHLDIAGTAWCTSPRFDCPKGATGVGVRLLTSLLKHWAK